MTITIYYWLFLGVFAAASILWRVLRSNQSSETAGDKRKELRRIEVEYGFPERDPNRQND